MSTPVWRSILRGIKSTVVTPPVGTGGTVSAEYCYSVYLRHLVVADRHGFATDPRTVVELGPGDSLGIGLMALLAGAEQYYAIDAVRHASSASNLLIFDKLVKLLADKVPIPSGGEFSEVQPTLNDYSFPAGILGESRLARSLDPSRIGKLRAALEGELMTGPIRYLAPMGRMNEIPGQSVDFIVSQAVMEHVDKLEETYAECARCLKPGGFMSHQIDLRSHDTAPEWNGHWKYADFIWGLMRGGRPWFINRLPCSEHLRLIRLAGLNIGVQLAQTVTNEMTKQQLAKRFRTLSDSDLSTAGVLVLASKPA
ncbi:MAG: methyltransferase domain-containing protein [Rhodocyclaceae bacterium]